MATSPRICPALRVPHDVLTWDGTSLGKLERSATLIAMMPELMKYKWVPTEPSKRINSPSLAVHGKRLGAIEITKLEPECRKNGVPWIKSLWNVYTRSMAVDTGKVSRIAIVSNTPSIIKMFLKCFFICDESTGGYCRSYRYSFTASIFSLCIVDERSRFSRIEVTPPMMYPKHAPPTIMENMATNLSVLLTITMSPYPTVVIVVNAQ
mmetsp:Transcript_23544/g.72700  ORF Transcript_23544/g.72700 Transcript_23544/m.72700 type:complete len:208 (+) Transcript_23544:1802-2425(+)